jgi:hypothetical protein
MILEPQVGKIIEDEILPILIKIALVVGQMLNTVLKKLIIFQI